MNSYVLLDSNTKIINFYFEKGNKTTSSYKCDEEREDLQEKKPAHFGCLSLLSSLAFIECRIKIALIHFRLTQAIISLIHIQIGH